MCVSGAGHGDPRRPDTAVPPGFSVGKADGQTYNDGGGDRGDNGDDGLQVLRAHSVPSAGLST